MKYILTLFLGLNLVYGQITHPILPGQNPGYYSQYQTAFGGTGSADSIYMLAYRSGVRSLRVSVSYANYENYGTFTPQFQFMGQHFSNNTFFLDAAEAPYKARDTIKNNGVQTWLPKGLYLSALNADGSVNVNNAYAKYIYDIVMSNGAFITYYEVWNEPDLNNTGDSYEDSTQSKTSWQNHEPNPVNLININAPVKDYVQLCKVAYQVVHKFQPNAIVCTGGISNPWFYKWFLKDGGGQWIDELSMHFYPIYSWVYYPNVKRRNSNYAVFRTDSNYLLLAASEIATGTVHKPIQWTEVNVNRWSRPGNISIGNFPDDKEFGNDIVQRNFDIKVILKQYQCGATGFHFFATGEAADSADQTNVNWSMGFYKNLNKAGVIGKEQKTQAGIAITALTNLTHNYLIENTQIGLASVDGVIMDSGVSKVYVLWDNYSLGDTNEIHSTTYTLPAGNWQRVDWDGSNLGTVSGLQTVTMTPNYFFQTSENVTPVTPPPDTVVVIPPPVVTTKVISGIKVQYVNSRSTQVSIFYTNGTNKITTVAKGFLYETTYVNNGKPYADVKFSDGSDIIYNQ